MRSKLKTALDIIFLSSVSLVFTKQAVFAEDELSVSLSPGAAIMTPTPEIFTSTPQTLTVSTTSIAGYTVNISPSGPSNALINQTDSNITIPTFTLPEGSTSLPASSTGYGYGYSIDNGANYFPIPDPDSTQRIFETNDAEENEHILTFGTLIPITKPYGNYISAVTLYVVAKLDPCPASSICYYGNGDDGTGAMDNQSASSNTVTTLIPPNFSRPGYGFAGWNTAIDGTGTNYGPNEDITTGDLSLVGLQLYAKWIPSAGNLQNWNGCNNMNEGDMTALTDTRDGNTYTVAKLADGQCWMTENLRLDLSTPSLEISELNTNKPTASFAQSINNDHPAPTNSFCSTNSSGCANRILYNTNNINRNLEASYDANNASSSWYAYGNYYNWYTLTAGNGTYQLSTAGVAADGDLCPSNWRLPAGYGDMGDLARLDIAAGGNGKNQTSGSSAGLVGSRRWRTYPMNFMYSGEQRGDSTANRGASSSYATLSVASNERTSNLWLKTDGVYMNSNNTPKVRGQTVRCLYNEGYHVNGNIHYDANGGSGTMVDENNVDFGTAVAANNGFTKQFSAFVSWNSEPDGSGVTVAEGGMVAGAADRMGLTDGETLTLYAIWRSEYSLVYDGNGADEGSMSNVKVSSVTTGSLQLVAPNFSRIGYGFAGWSLDSSAATKLMNGESVTVYGPNETISVNSDFLANADPSNNQVSLYAVWLPEDSTYTMQSFSYSQCSAMSIGDILALKDTRDNNVYSVAKLEDGNCWMVENLRLDPAVTTLDDNNTNFPTTDFATAAPSSSTANTLCNADDPACVDDIYFNSNNIDRNLTAKHNENSVNVSWYSYGIMYNWYTASAGNGTFAMNIGNVAGDICPRGWRLPTGGENGEFVTLNNLSNNNSVAIDTGFRKFPNNFIYSGDFNYNKPGGRSTYGRWWSATPNGNAKAFRMGITYNASTPTGSWNKWDAFAIRCIVKPQQ